MNSINRDNQFWEDMAREMQRAMSLHSLTEEEAARAYQKAPEIPLTVDEIDDYLAIAKSRIPKEPSYDERIPPGNTYSEIDSEIGEVIGLHRHEGELDPEVEEEMKRQRENALRDDEDDDDASQS